MWFLHLRVVVTSLLHPAYAKQLSFLSALWHLPPQASSGEAVCRVLLLNIFCSSFLHAWFWYWIPWIMYHLGQSFWFLTQEGTWVRQGAADNLVTEPAFSGVGHYFSSLVIVLGKLLWGPSNFCWIQGLRKSWNFVQKLRLSSNGGSQKRFAHAFQISVPKVSFLLFLWPNELSHPCASLT